MMNFEVLDIRHIPGLVRKTLDLALTPKNIKAGLVATGICPYNPDVFSDSDFIQADVSGENFAAAAIDDGLDENDQLRIIIQTVAGVQTLAPNDVASSSTVVSNDV